MRLPTANLLLALIAAVPVRAADAPPAIDPVGLPPRSVPEPVARDVAPPFEVEGPLILTTTFRRQPEQNCHVVHLLNQGSSWGQHSIYQKLAPLPEELNKQWGFPNRSELRGTWPVREEVIPLGNIKVRCRVPGVTKATLQPGGAALPLAKTDDGVVVTVNDLGMHAMVVFE